MDFCTTQCVMLRGERDLGTQIDIINFHVVLAAEWSESTKFELGLQQTGMKIR